MNITWTRSFNVRMKNIVVLVILLKTFTLIYNLFFDPLSFDLDELSIVNIVFGYVKIKHIAWPESILLFIDKIDLFERDIIVKNIFFFLYDDTNALVFDK